MKKLILSLIFLLTLVTSVFAEGKTLTKYTGKTSRDIELAKKVYELGMIMGVLAVEVEESTMTVHINQRLYREISNDRAKGNNLMRAWHTFLALHYSEHNTEAIWTGTVWLYVDGQKVAKCESEDSFATVTWLND